MSQHAGVGADCFGESAFGEDVELDDTRPVFVPAPGRRRAEFGFGYSERTFSRAYEYTLPSRRVPSTTVSNIKITSVSGALIGTIRTDILHSVVNYLEYTLNAFGGCADFTLKLNKLPPFEIEPLSFISVNIADSVNNRYIGQLSYPQKSGTDRDLLVFKGYGLSRALERLDAQTDYPLGMDLTDIIRDIVINWIAPYSPILYDESLIDSVSGVVLSDKLELGKFKIRHVLEIFSDMAQVKSTPEAEGWYYIWGVNGDGKFYWKKVMRDTYEKSLYIGYQLHEFKPQLNFENIKNLINLQKQVEKGSDVSGYGLIGIYNRVPSVKKYGVNELTKKLPGWFGQAEGDIYGNALADELSEPRPSGSFDRYQAIVESEFLNNGNYRIVGQLDRYQEVINDIDEATEWAITGSGEMTVEKDEDIFMYADGCPKFNVKNSENQIAQMDVVSQGLIKKVIFYVRANRKGQYITAGFGSSVWNQYTVKIDIPILNTFIPIEWDVSAFDVRKIGKFGIQVNETIDTDTFVWLDKMSAEFSGHKTYKMRLTRVTERFAADGSTCKGEFGVLPASFVQYVAGLQAAVSELSGFGEVV